jgi:hypothetical protein
VIVNPDGDLELDIGSTDEPSKVIPIGDARQEAQLRSYLTGFLLEYDALTTAGLLKRDQGQVASLHAGTRQRPRMVLCPKDDLLSKP